MYIVFVCVHKTLMKNTFVNKLKEGKEAEMNRENWTATV